MNDASLSDIHLPLASPTALTVGLMGKYLIWSGTAAFLLGLVQSLFFPKHQKIGSFAAIVGGLSVIGAFATLGTLLVHNQYEFRYVWDHSDIRDPVAYKIAAIWSGQEGSFLLWATTSSVFLLLSLWGTGSYRRWYGLVYFAFLASLCGILTYESPFNLIPLAHGKVYVPPNGAGLTASLNNYWLVIHPPTIFTGFGALTIPFAYAFSAMITQNYKDWAAQVRPWALLCLSVVGIGLCMGGFWAYETLGWGGFWKWDPVEGVSFVPFITTAALVHGLIMQGTKGRWMVSNLLMAGVPYLMFVYGTFLTRAGFLDGASIHSFAEMEHTAHMVLLTYCVTSAAGFLGLWGYRALVKPPAQPPEPAASEGASTHREGWYRFGNIMLSLIGVATAIGMSVPLFQVIAHQKPKMVDETLYHYVLSWFFIPAFLGMAIAPFVSWRRMPVKELLGRIFNVFSLTIGLLGITMIVMNRPEMGVHYVPGTKVDFPFHLKVPMMPWVMFLFGVCLFVIVGNVWRIVELRRAKPLSWGSFIAHIGVAIAMSGLIISRGLERIQTYAMQESDIATPLMEVDENQKPIQGASLLPYSLMLHDVDEAKLNERDNKLHIDVHGDGDSFAADPGFYFITEEGEQKLMATPSINHSWSHDTYVALGGQDTPARDPQSLVPGETKEFDVDDPQTGSVLPYRLTYQKMERQGEVGQSGTKFLADVQVEVPNGAKILVKPSIQIGSEGGPDIQPAIVDADYFLTMMRMDAATKGVTLQMNYVRPIYWANVMYKPMVGLVPLGAAIMTIGGLMSALYRRKRPASAPKDQDPEARV
jgi:cytochrome c-type biogenesis protein CcmF